MAHIKLFFNCPKSFYQKYNKNHVELKGIFGIKTLSGFFKEIDLELDNDINEDEIKEDLNEFDEKNKSVEIIKRNNITKKILRHLHHLFENFESIAEELISIIINISKKNKSKELKKRNPEYYEKMNKIFHTITVNNTIDYYYFTYEDFILIFCRIIKYYTGLHLKLQFTKLPNSFCLSIFGNDEELSKLAEFNEYELKLKNYAYKYQFYSDEYEKKKKENSSTENSSLELGNLITNTKSKNLIVQEWIPLKYNELNINNSLHWSPYKSYSNDKEEKFQRYDKNDDYHECNVSIDNDDICDKCSKFRNIDKIRIIYNIVDKIIKINYMIDEQLLKYILIQRNYVSYQEKLSFKNLIVYNLNIFNNNKNMEFIMNIRNFYGEIVSYYFLWITNYIKWLTFPTVIGLLLYYKIFIIKHEDFEELNNLIYGTLIILWATLFYKQWIQKEKIYNYIWGTEKFSHSEPDREDFIPDDNIKIMFYHNFPYINPIKKKIKITISYLVLFFMLLTTMFCVYFIFFTKLILIQKYPRYSTYIGFLISMLNSIQIKLLNFTYKNIANSLNNWENYQKDFLSKNSLAVKIILFDIINNYFSIFYIAFFKRTHFLGKPIEECIGYDGNDSCFEEIRIHLQTNHMMTFLFDLIEIGIPFLKQRARKLILKKNINKEIIIHNLEHQMISDSYDNIMFEYGKLIIHLGYVIFFSVASPLTPILVFFLIYFERICDTYKIFYLQRVSFIGMSIGLEIFNNIIHSFIYLGYFINIGLIVFGDSYFLPDISFEIKLIIFISGIILLNILCNVINWNILPYWFFHLDEIKELYQKKYFLRGRNNLPHFNLLEKIFPESINDESKDSSIQENEIKTDKIN